MRVLTLQEPWASLIGEGIKTIETRSGPVISMANYISMQEKLGFRKRILMQSKPQSYCPADYIMERYWQSVISLIAF